MKILHDVSLQNISWVKSNKDALEGGERISTLFYPENTDELIALVRDLLRRDESYDIVGHSSNTLFQPSYHVDNMICTKNLNKWRETEDGIVCECGVNVSVLSSKMVECGYEGFEGLTDLPGTIGAAIYGNAGCRNCSVIELLDKFTLLTDSGELVTCTREQLNATVRSTSLKRKELRGVIIDATLAKRQGDAQRLKETALRNHRIRQEQQPSASNNLGTTIVASQKTFKGKVFALIEMMVKLFTGNKDPRRSFPKTLKLLGYGDLAPYTYYWNRYIFKDADSHLLFDKYQKLIMSLYKDARLEIEIRK